MNEKLASDLRGIVGHDNVATDNDQLDRFAGDALGVYRAFQAGSRMFAIPGVVVWPTSTEEISRILRFAHRHQVPVVPYGQGTGVMGAATAIDGCIVLSLQKMTSIIDVSKEDLTARLQPGVVLEDAASALDKSALILGHDPWSRPVATVGGAISTNGVGYTAAKYGTMGEQVLGLEVVLADGEIIRTRAMPKSSSGPSLENLFIGSEGTLGVIAEATIRAFPMPEKRLLRGIVFPDFESGFKAVAQLYVEDVRPAMIDYGEEFWDGGQPERSDATLYLAFEGFKESVRAHDERAREICYGLGGRDGDEADVQCFWKERHASGENYRRRVLEDPIPGEARRRLSSYRMDYLHVALPVSQVLEYRRRCQELLEERCIIVREWSLWGRPEFFSFLIVEEGDEGDEISAAMGDTVDKVLTLAQEMGGSMEYCHGVGIKLAHLMDNEMGAGMDVVRKIKKALDPKNILNPGKLVA